MTLILFFFISIKEWRLHCYKQPATKAM